MLRVPGPQGKVLLVFTDVQQGNGANPMIGLAVAPTEINFTASDVVTGAANNVGLELAAVSAAPSLMRAYGLLQWWNKICGNPQDWKAACLLVGDIYALYNPGPRRHKDTAELTFWNDENGDPFTDHGFYAEASTDDIGNIRSCMVSAIGHHSFDQEVSFAHYDYRIAAIDPMTECGLAAGFFEYTDAGKVSFGKCWTDVASMLLSINRKLACATDLAMQRFGVPEALMFAGGSAFNRGISVVLQKLVKDTIASYWYAVVGGFSVKPIWASWNRLHLAYLTLVPNTRLSAGCSRIHTWWLEYYTKEPLLPRDDFGSVQRLGYWVRTIDDEVTDVLQKCTVSDLAADRSLEYSLRWLTSTGGFTGLVPTDVSWLRLTDDQGSVDRHVPIHYSPPTSGLALEIAARGSGWRAPRNSDIKEYMHSSLPLLVAEGLGGRRMHIGLVNGRALTVAEHHNPTYTFVTRGKFFSTRGSTYRDSSSVDDAEIASWGNFRL
jgi:hypothetical protein